MSTIQYEKFSSNQSNHKKALQLAYTMFQHNPSQIFAVSYSLLYWTHFTVAYESKNSSGTESIESSKSVSYFPSR